MNFYRGIISKTDKCQYRRYSSAKLMPRANIRHGGQDATMINAHSINPRHKEMTTNNIR
ncbi:hypothetical protein Q5H94_12745 [Sphingomonas sp. CA1-15]|uniref:Uncharacterized protein n=1 Tax=Sphingomonas immobilis TaxID=3063997 RepID=A0ABT9A031_9SPHN|nr:hypothetical protein [Sphingomonas sp. CA1-15]